MDKLRAEKLKLKEEKDKLRDEKVSLQNQIERLKGEKARKTWNRQGK